MRSTSRRLLSYSLLAIYVGISVLGQGLHWLSPDDGHHHGLDVVSCATHGHHEHQHCIHDVHDATALAHDADGYQAQDGTNITANSCATNSHVCEICAFLFQVLDRPPQPATVFVSQPLVAAVPCPQQRLYSPTSLGPHAPRGPPLVLA